MDAFGYFLELIQKKFSRPGDVQTSLMVADILTLGAEAQDKHRLAQEFIMEEKLQLENEKKIRDQMTVNSIRPFEHVNTAKFRKGIPL